LQNHGVLLTLQFVLTKKLRVAVLWISFQFILYLLIIGHVLFAIYNENDQVKENEMSRACSTYEKKRNA
jgi:energy-coupling factor transporter transmembrane protein EcfT